MAVKKTVGEACGKTLKVADFNLLTAPGHLLRRNHQRSFDIFHRHVGDGVTRQQIALLVALSQRAGASQSDLVEATGMDKSTLKELIGRMVQRGLAVRERHPSDGRAWQMYITTAGSEMLEALLPKVRQAQAEILSPLSKDDQRQFLRYLRTLIGHEED